MNNFTYEKETKIDKRIEKYEWDNVWFEHADGSCPNSQRVAYIGDSISCGTRQIATKLSNEEILFDGFGSSKSIDNPFLFDSLKLFLNQLPYVKTVVFNSGLHGWHLEDNEEYKKYYSEAIKFLTTEYPDAKIFIALTTAVENKERHERVILRNKAATSVANEFSLPIIDLYTITSENMDMLSKDGVHPTESLYEKIAEEIIKNVK